MSASGRREVDEVRVPTPGAKALSVAARTASAMGVEAAWVAAHLVTYPLGLLLRDLGDDLDPRRFRIADLPLAQRGLLTGHLEAATTPVVLVHGIVDNRTIFTVLRRQLKRRGFGCIRTFSYPPHANDIRRIAEWLASFVEEVCHDTDADHVFVVGHSLGGLVSRYYVQRLGGDVRVHTLVTLGSPHHGTLTARLAPPRIVKQLRPSSNLMRELEQPADCRTRFLVVYSDADQLIVPTRNASLVHHDLDVRNVMVRGVGHMSLPINGRVVHEVCATLARRGEAAGSAALLPLTPPGA